MKKLLPLILLLSGCGMSRQETIDAFKECRDGGLQPTIVYNWLTNKISDVVCFDSKPSGER